jgi:MFS superfamily sulfate permease-like transporter
VVGSADRQGRCGVECVIHDAEAISDFGSTAAEALENLDTDLERLGADLWIARANGPPRQLLTVTGLTKRLGSEPIYPLVRAAVTAYVELAGMSERRQRRRVLAGPTRKG